MSGVPRHPDTNESVGPRSGGDAAKRSQWWWYVGGIVVVALIVVMVVLHLTGAIGAGAH